MSVIGTITPDSAGVILGTGYGRFYSESGIDGLCKISGHRLDLLAVIARNPGTGQFRRFIMLCKLEFTTICVWAIERKELAPVLDRYGFYWWKEFDHDANEMVEGMRWDKST